MTEIQNVLIIRYGEIALKGMNRPYFEKALVKRLRKSVESRGGNLPPERRITIEVSAGLIIARGYEPDEEAVLIRDFLRVFGVSTVSPAWELASREQTDINATCVEWIRGRISNSGEVTFKVFGKRADKSWPITSPEIAALAGEAILLAFGEDKVRVDVNNPAVRLHVHLRQKNVLIYEESIKGFGGLPLGTNGKGLVLLSGGIDSPVAAWFMAKRGMTIEAVHFHSYPYTSKRAEDKVKDLAGALASYCGRVKVHMLNILPAQEAFAEACPEEEMTILTRRFMMRLASRIAVREGCGFLITGENLGQVASQTAEGIAVCDKASSLPVLRPLIAMDKVDIMEIAKKIDTYDISVQPYEDCCTVFLPQHPVTRPELPGIEASEALLGEEKLTALEEGVLASEELFIARI